jgi:hypothetical protein
MLDLYRTHVERGLTQEQIVPLDNCPKKSGDVGLDYLGPNQFQP